MKLYVDKLDDRINYKYLELPTLYNEINYVPGAKVKGRKKVIYIIYIYIYI